MKSETDLKMNNLAQSIGELTTVHSVKGLDYACVFIVGLDWLEPGRWTEKQIDKIAYVAVTRARQRLFIPYCFEDNQIYRILKDL